MLLTKPTVMVTCRGVVPMLRLMLVCTSFPRKHTHTHLEKARYSLTYITEVFERTGQATQEAVKKLQRARKRA